MKFYFDYIYYRITKAYFKWDGRTGATGIFAVLMIQILLIMDINAILNVLFLTRAQTRSYVDITKWIYSLIFIGLFIFNYKKYNGKYNSFRSHWKDESKKQRTIKGLLVILSLIMPWIPVILIGILWDRK